MFLRRIDKIYPLSTTLSLQTQILAKVFLDAETKEAINGGTG